VVNVSTSGVLRTVSGTDAYIAAKGGVLALTKAMAVSLADRGVRVNVVCPGVFGTEEVEHRLDDPRVKTMLARTAPVGRGYGEPGEFAATVEFLCSPAASFINAAEITVDRGRQRVTGIDHVEAQRGQLRRDGAVRPRPR
jgi:NAD(P)-dependent dehydrogenase (short-subunit alcohol dehydrogenase family)